MRRSEGVLIVGGKLKIVRKAKRLGLHVLYLQKKEQYTPEHHAFVDHAVLTDYEDERVALAMARALHEIAPFTGALSLTEPGLLPAARINDALGLGGASYRTARLLREKWEMRQFLNVRNFSPVAAAQGSTRAELEAFLRTQGFPVILKPIDGSASLGVARIGAWSELGAAWATFANSGAARFIVEEELDGPEVSVESCSYRGRHVILAVTEKRCAPNFVEIAHVLPAALPREVESALLSCVRDFLDLVGLANGPAHTEVKLTARGPRIVESHNRIGGDKINELVELAVGLDMDSLALALPFGLIDEPVDRPHPRQAAAIRFFTPEPGELRALGGLEQARTAEGVVDLELDVAPGDRIAPLRSSMQRVGHVIAVGSSPAEALARCEHACGLLRFTIAPDAREGAPAA